MQWLLPLLWPFIRTMALLTGMPIFNQAALSIRVRVGLAFFIALASQASLPAMPLTPLDNLPLLLMLLAQQLLIGIAMGFAVRVVFAVLEFAGELNGLQMGLNFAGFFDHTTGAQGTSTASFYTNIVSFLFIAINGHLLLIQALVQSFQVFPVGVEPFHFLRAAQPQVWGAEIFRMGLWVALPPTRMLLFVNIVMGVIARVAPQIGIFAVGFPLTISIGLVGMMATLPLMQGPFNAVLERLLSAFQ